MSKVKRETTREYMAELRKQQVAHELSKAIARLSASVNSKRLK